MTCRLQIVAACIWVVLLCLPGPTFAQVAGPVPADLEGVGITQKLDAQIPLDLKFTDENGNTVTLGEFFTEDRPVILTLVYYRCPMLCNLVLEGLIETLQGIDWVPGEEFEIVTVSIDPLETPELARAKKQNYLAEYGRPAAAAGWHFLTGKPEAIKALTETVGFGYRWVDERKEYAHAAAFFVSTPEGRLSRYLFGIRHEPRTLRLSLVEAAEGEIGSVVDQFLLYCYKYDAASGKYTAVAWRIMRLGGVLTVLILGAALLTFWKREFRLTRKHA